MVIEMGKIVQVTISPHFPMFSHLSRTILAIFTVRPPHEDGLGGSSSTSMISMGASARLAEAQPESPQKVGDAWEKMGTSWEKNTVIYDIIYIYTQYILSCFYDSWKGGTIYLHLWTPQLLHQHSLLVWIGHPYNILERSLAVVNWVP